MTENSTQEDLTRPNDRVVFTTLFVVLLVLLWLLGENVPS